MPGVTVNVAPASSRRPPQVPAGTTAAARARGAATCRSTRSRVPGCSPSTLWAARNDIIAKYVYDPVDRARATWIELARERAAAQGLDQDFIIPRGDGRAVSFLLLGDPGEGDSSQYGVVPALLSVATGVDFAIICSDVVYPSGESGAYRTTA